MLLKMKCIVNKFQNLSASRTQLGIKVVTCKPRYANCEPSINLLFNRVCCAFSFPF